MITKETLQNARKLLQKHHQGHLLAFWDQLTPSQRQSLLAQIEQLDFSQIDDWVATYVKPQILRLPRPILLLPLTPNSKPDTPRPENLAKD
ncbi:MAG: hypothetical protein ACYSX1_13465 [Planctomycetota bacterium]|jgi:hypothetical protein